MRSFDVGLARWAAAGLRFMASLVAFKVYDMDRDGYISNGELYLVLKQMVGNNLKVSCRSQLKASRSTMILVVVFVDALSVAPLSFLALSSRDAESEDSEPA
jgi:hypothetical protein